jgi:hypothetical protein
MVNKTDILKLFLLSALFITASCSNNREWDLATIKTISTSIDNKEKKRVFTKKVLPILRNKHNNLLADYANCTGKEINESSYLPLVKGALIREHRIDLLKNIMDVSKDSLDIFVIEQLKLELLKREPSDREWITVLIMLLPEEKSAIANVRGILCSIQNSNNGLPINKKLFETIEAAF